jgi:acetylornithine deacetylase/succinyl-diaminopimelate desuccinylase-like protein
MILRHADSVFFRPLLNREFSKDKNLNAMTRNTISMTVLRAGEAPNAIPGRAEAVLDVRMIPGTDHQRVIRDIEDLVKACGASVEVIAPPFPGPDSPFRSKAFSVIEGILTGEFPGSLVIPFMDTGGSDSKHFRNKGIHCYGIMPVVLTEKELNTIHGVNERISVENLKLGVRLMHKILCALCDGDI